VSITFKLELGPPVAPDAVVAVLVAVGDGGGDADGDGDGARVVEAHAGTSGSLRGGGWFDVDAAEDDPPDPEERRFGFAPAVEVYIGLRKFGDLEAQTTDVLRLALGVLAGVPGDALLHREHDEVWLLRRRGRLTVNAGLWTPAQLGLLRSHPHESGSLAFD
jgi:hypothetical protein